MIVSIHCVN